MFTHRYLCTALTLCVFSVGKISSAEEISFNQDVRPILKQHCLGCHGGVKQAADLSFVYQDEASYTVEVGDPDVSLLIERVTAEDESEVMPPPEHGERLTKEEVDTLKQWIREGAKWGQHWAYDLPQKSEPEVATTNTWVRQRIDRFILQRLGEEDLKPSPEATPERWLRRVSLDLVGLPPSQDEIRQFKRALKRNGDQAYDQTVERLLTNDGFGERWASVWLDAVRYADSRGLGLDARRTIWKYRDWVINAFNDDMPYDQFTVKQLAGDLLPNRNLEDVLATACNRLTQTCEEGGTDDEQFRVEAVIDRVNTTMLAWQGLTFGCVQCHSHPFEPIGHEEYYNLLAFFNNSADCDLGDEAPNLMVPLEEEEYASAWELDQDIKAVEFEQWQEGWNLAEAADWGWPESLKADTNNTTQVTTVIGYQGGPEYQTQGNVAKSTTVNLTATLPDELQSITAIRFTGIPENLELALKDSEWGFVITNITASVVDENGGSQSVEIAAVVADEPHPLLPASDSLNKSGRGFSAYTRIHRPRTAVFILKQPLLLEGKQIQIALQQNSVALGAFPLVAHRGQVAFSNAPELSSWIGSDIYSKREAELKKLKAARKAIKSVPIPIMDERFAATSRPSHVFDRGNYLVKTDLVSPAPPEFITPEESTSSEPTRLDLAQWIANSNNPLTARVAVNRVWGQLFGIGIVDTQEDFGSTGSHPSHPALLDDLSYRFMHDMHWSTKDLIREIVLSSTYRQSSASNEKLRSLDPQNRLLARGPRFRLPAETIRDQALAISDLLSRNMYGPPVHPPIPDGVWLPFQGGDKWSTPEVGDPNRYRRTIYTYMKRTIQFPMLASFDAPTREFCAPRRLPSNTPLQALMTLNDATFVEAAEALAKRMQANGDNAKQRVRFGLRIALCRSPKKAEVQPLLDLYEAEIKEAKNAEANNPEDESPDDEKAELAALSTVASVILNLDEVLNK